MTDYMPKTDNPVKVLRATTLIVTLFLPIFTYINQNLFMVKDPVIITPVFFFVAFILTFAAKRFVLKYSNYIFITLFYIISIDIYILLYINRLHIIFLLYLLLIFICIPPLFRYSFLKKRNFFAFVIMNLLSLSMIYLNTENPNILDIKNPENLIYLLIIAIFFISIFIYLALRYQFKFTEKIYEEEERYRTIMESLSEGIIITDRKGIVLYANSKMEELTGLRRADLIGKTTKLLLLPHDKYIKGRRYRQGDPKEDTFEIRHTLSDGREYWLEIHSAPYFDQNGAVIGIVGAISDITQRKKDEEAIYRSEAQLRALWETVPVPMTVISRVTGNVIYANKPFEEFMDTEVKDLIGRELPDDLLTDQDKNNLAEEILAGNEIEHRRFKVNNRPGGTWTIISTRNLSFAGETAILVSILNINRTVVAQEELAEERDKLSSLLSTVPCTISWIDKDFKYIAVNKKMCDTLGLKESSIIGKKVGFINNNEKFLNFVGSVFSSDIQTHYTELPLKIRDDKVETFFLAAQKLANGKEAIIVGLDVTERKQLEEQLMIRQRLDSIGTLAGGIAHDFNNILTGIMGNLSMVDLKKNEESYSQKKYIDNALKACERATDLIMEFQNLSGKYKSEKKNFDIYDVAEEVFNLLKRTSDKLIDKKLDLEKGRFFVRANPSEVNQALLNLGTNSVSAIEASGVKAGSFIRIEAEEFQSTGKHLAPGDYIHLIFSDNGEGMSSEVRKKAFDPLFTTRSKSKKRGQGLGLAMVYNIITGNNEGHIYIDSIQDEGTKMHIYLPKGENPGDKKKKKKDDEEVVRGSETILCIDDEDIILELSSNVLGELGYKVMTAKDGSSGIKAYQEYMSEIDLIILDLTMPKMPGLEVLQKIIEMDPKARVLLSTGYHHKEIDGLTMALTKGIVKKPYQVSILSQMIRKALDD